MHGNVLTDHQYKDLTISLPSNWKYLIDEENDLELCFDPVSKSALRITVLMMIPPPGISRQEQIEALSGGEQYRFSSKGYLLVGPIYKSHNVGGRLITIITWKLINISGHEKILAVLSYEVRSEDKDSEIEEEVFDMIEKSLDAATLYEE